jgi:hypothetical protein
MMGDRQGTRWSSSLPDLTLRRANISRGDGTWGDDDFDSRARKCFTS